MRPVLAARLKTAGRQNLCAIIAQSCETPVNHISGSRYRRAAVGRGNDPDPCSGRSRGRANQKIQQTQ
jgi:hypothetical protein